MTKVINFVKLLFNHTKYDMDYENFTFLLTNVTHYSHNFGNQVNNNVGR
jgi:hypothetical protein